MKIFFNIFFIIFSLFCYQSYSTEIKTIIQIDNNSITNIDLQNEIRIIEILENRKISDVEKQIILKDVINFKIKELECEKLKINVSKETVNKRVNKILNNNQEIQEPELKKIIYKKIKIQSQWNRLVLLRFKNKVEININEIKENILSKNLPKDNLNQYIEIEKEKKLNILSRAYLNEVKSKYLVKTIQ